VQHAAEREKRTVTEFSSTNAYFMQILGKYCTILFRFCTIFLQFSGERFGMEKAIAESTHIYLV
jgi:hypothetical protein